MAAPMAALAALTTAAASASPSLADAEADVNRLLTLPSSLVTSLALLGRKPLKSSSTTAERSARG